ncbi:DUF1801 domain-containing protein [Frigoriflavimonas asaccharolytica]|uniref:YdhG-like domain-containing protein n=1 Tax=Frigoriflavimonas asaccharolytica TaxID=2735899 RepID=A0A8J8G3W0_9FLAO|nr:DUF1801 domain-containing protein [Frigoriflavimonas asaccharolytica]NRS90973.1 hypothetical protein [Frigoriflavimonas asaccharolytica]
MLVFLRDKILNSDEKITETLSFGLPFFKYKKKMLCYFHFHKKYKEFYISFNKGVSLDFPELLQEDRKLFRILLLNEAVDLPMDLIFTILEAVKKELN